VICHERDQLLDVSVVVIPHLSARAEVDLERGCCILEQNRNTLGEDGLMSRARKPQVTENTEKKLRNLKPFKPGHSGNPKGRPKGARNRLGTQFLEALEADFNQFGPQAIAFVRERKPEVYVRVVADLLPKEANINVEAGEAFVELWRRISDGLGDKIADCLDDEPTVVMH
jgi:hypothetical protein